jgi:putative transposase
VKVVCGYFGVSRSGYYKATASVQERAVQEGALVEQVCRWRSLHPYMGVRKLRHVLALEGAVIGRDRFFDLLRREGLLVGRKRRYARTTDSGHGFRVYPNRLKELELKRPGQVWVSDITYVRTQSGFRYLSLITDAYSRKIVGWSLWKDLTIEGSLKALKMALKEAGKSQDTIHHSDRGVQYCSKAYVKKLLKAGMQISMTQDNHCYENAQAERVNGILKQEYGLYHTFKGTRQCRAAVEQAIWLYNHQRPHWALGFNTPQQVHQSKAA